MRTLSQRLLDVHIGAATPATFRSRPSGMPWIAFIVMLALGVCLDELVRGLLR